jgi:hypothetical protein
MLAVGGWLGISYNNPRVDRVAAIIFGAGGGLIGDEAEILLTFKRQQLLGWSKLHVHNNILGFSIDTRSTEQVFKNGPERFQGIIWPFFLR